MSQSESVANLAAALAKAQGLFTNPSRDREVKVTLKDNKGTYTFRYATLSAIMDMIRVPLSTNGLALSHLLGTDDQGTICETRLTHASGEWMSTWIPVLVSESANAQGWGSAITYSRRYGVCTLLGIAADEDDDSNAACGNEAEPVARPTRKPAAKPSAKPTALTDEEKAKIKATKAGLMVESLRKAFDFKIEMHPVRRVGILEALAESDEINAAQLEWMRKTLLSIPDLDADTVNGLTQKIDAAISAKTAKKPKADPPKEPAPLPEAAKPFATDIEAVCKTLADCDEWEGINFTLVDESLRPAVKAYLEAHRKKLP
jgi:hypothetical protein